MVYSTGPYGDPGYLQMALGAYLTPSSSGYKSVDPYFLSQGMQKINKLYTQYNLVMSFSLRKFYSIKTSNINY